MATGSTSCGLDGSLRRQWNGPWLCHREGCASRKTLRAGLQGAAFPILASPLPRTHEYVRPGLYFGSPEAGSRTDKPPAAGARREPASKAPGERTREYGAKDTIT